MSVQSRAMAERHKLVGMTTAIITLLKHTGQGAQTQAETDQQLLCWRDDLECCVGQTGSVVLLMA